MNRYIIVPAVTLLMMIGFLIGCSVRNPDDLQRWYAENYPSIRSTGAARPAGNATRKPELPPAEEMRVPSASEMEKPAGAVWPPTVAQNNERSGSLPVARGYLPEPVDVKYANDPSRVSDYSVVSMLEDKLFRLIEEAYQQRDEAEFSRLFQFFHESFPYSGRRAQLDEKWRTFFYSEDLAVDQLKDALVELAYPAADSLQALGLYFAKLRGNGIRAVQIDVVQWMEKPVYLFADSQHRQGYYFNAPRPYPVVDDLLGKVVALAHENGLVVYASFPFRHHPLLGQYSELLVDESWDVFRKETAPNGKLDLLNPASFRFLIGLIKSLLAYSIDGVIFKDDFTYDRNEGFSAIAQQRFTEGTGRSIVFNRLFVPIQSSGQEPYQIIADGEFSQIALWRTREVKQFIWDLIAETRRMNPGLRIGFEVTPAMLIDDDIAVNWYATGLHYLRDLAVDFYILKWRKGQTEAESDPGTYRKAATVLREAIPGETEIFMKVPLSAETRNVIHLNRRIRSNAELQRTIEGTKMAIGPVTRYDMTDFIN
jgi:hypothetical protein